MLSALKGLTKRNMPEVKYLFLLFVACAIMQFIVFAVIRMTCYSRLSGHIDIDTLPVVIGLKSISFNNAIVVVLTVSGTLVLDQMIGIF
jgi:hypothetical protein